MLELTKDGNDVIFFKIVLELGSSVTLCYSYILSVWEMERAPNLKPALPWKIDVFWNVMCSVYPLQLKIPAPCAWFACKANIKKSSFVA